MIPYDKVGKPIAIGNYIAYGHALGRCAGIQLGKVLDIKEPSPEGTPSWESKGWRITVIGLDDHWEHRAPELLSRKGTLQYPNRIIVLDTLPDVHKQLLDSYP